MVKANDFMHLNLEKSTNDCFERVLVNLAWT